jgi:hypothetical protein
MAVIANFVLVWLLTPTMSQPCFVLVTVGAGVEFFGAAAAAAAAAAASVVVLCCCRLCCCVLQELDFVAANVMMAIIADFMLVWLPAPTLSFAAAAGAATAKKGVFDVFGRMFAGCPDNAFQKVQPGMPHFTLMQVSLGGGGGGGWCWGFGGHLGAGGGGLLASQHSGLETQYTLWLSRGC